MSTYKHDFRITDKKIHIPPLKRVPQTEGGCMCLECQKNALMAEQVSRRIKGYQGTQDVNPTTTRHKMEMPAVDHADEGYGESKTSPNYYIGSTLVALKPVKIYSMAGTSIGGKVLKTVQPGQVVGIVDTWVKDRKNPNAIWWRLKDGTYTPHFQGYFDPKKAVETSSGKEFVQKVEKANELNLNPLPLATKASESITNFIGNYKWYLIGVLVVILIAVFLRIKG